MPLQHLLLTLDGITSSDYLTWVRDPEPPALGLALRSITVGGDPLGDTAEALLSWNVPPPDAITAAALAGLPLTPEVIAVRSQTKQRTSWKSPTGHRRLRRRCPSPARP